MRLGAGGKPQGRAAVLVDTGRREFRVDVEGRRFGAGDRVTEDERGEREGVAADVEQAAAGEFGCEQPALRVERGPEAEGAGEPPGFADRTLGQPARDVAGRRQKAAPHGLHEQDAVPPGDAAHRAGLRGVHGERLFAQDRLALPKRQRRVLEMAGMGRGHVDGIDRLAPRELRVGPRPGGGVTALSVEGAGAVRVAAAGGGHFVTVQRVDGGGEGARDGAGAEDAPTNG